MLAAVHGELRVSDNLATDVADVLVRNLAHKLVVIATSFWLAVREKSMKQRH